MLHPETVLLPQESLDNLKDPAISTYFQSFNQGNFQTTASVFAADGQLLPPFESVIVGQEAIAAYLETEAKGMKALPEEASEQVLPSGERSISVLGQVQTPLFGVRVRWDFVFNEQAEIVMAKIKLLAALKDLLHLKPQT